VKFSGDGLDSGDWRLFKDGNTTWDMETAINCGGAAWLSPAFSRYHTNGFYGSQRKKKSDHGWGFLEFVSFFVFDLDIYACRLCLTST